MIYFIQADSGQGLIKIGYTKSDPMIRLKGIQTMCPTPLRVIGLMDGDTSMERNLHARFAEYRVYGEWFQPVNEIFNLISERGVEYSPIAYQKIEYRKLIFYLFQFGKGRRCMGKVETLYQANSDDSFEQARDELLKRAIEVADIELYRWRGQPTACHVLISQCKNDHEAKCDPESMVYRWRL